MCTDLLTIPCALLALVLFYKTKTLPQRPAGSAGSLSVIIPARNEAHNIPVLLRALNAERGYISEIIVVNDASTDETAVISRSFGAVVIDIGSRPEGWAGKPYACYCGAQAARGDLLLFLDADVIPRNGMIEKLLAAHEPGAVVSVQPYHQTEKTYEQASLFFNLMAVAAVGLCLPGKETNVGLFGPVLLMERNLYFETGGHEAVKNEIIEDFELGLVLRRKNIRCDLFLGRGCVSFQMYKGGLADLIWGWSKNFAGGAAKTPPRLFILSVLWLISQYSIAISCIRAGISFALGTGSLPIALIFAAVYLADVLLLYAKARKIGSFSLASCLLFPLPLAAFTLIFALSLLLRTVARRVRWKGRWIKIKREPRHA